MARLELARVRLGRHGGARGAARAGRAARARRAARHEAVGRRFSVSELAAKARLTAFAPPPPEAALRRERLHGALEQLKEDAKLKPLRKRLWWRAREVAFEHGFPLDTEPAEYAERRAADEAKFESEFPSLLWQERRAERLAKEADEAARVAEHLRKRALVAAQRKREQDTATVDRMRAFREREAQELLVSDAAALEHMAQAERNVRRFEDFERESEERALARARQEREEAERLAAAQRAAELKADEQRAAERDEAERLEHEALSTRIELLMRSSGTVATELTKTRPVERAPQTLVVRLFEGTDDRDGEILEYNLHPLTEYCKRFSRAKDHSRKFPQFFAASTRTVVGHNLGEAGAAALGCALAVGAFPRLAKLAVAFNDIRFKGLDALAVGLSTGCCTSLAHLVLSGNNLGDQSMEALRAALAKGSTATPGLRRIDLDSNEVGDDGAKALAHLVLADDGPRLDTLKLGSNKVGDAGAHALAMAGATRATIKIIVLRGNRVSPAQARRLVASAPFLAI